MTSELVFPPIFNTLCSLLSAEKQVYLVGGAVRDAVIGRINHDLDFVMPASIRRIARQVANTLNGAFYMLDEEREIARIEPRWRKEVTGVHTLNSDGDITIVDARRLRLHIGA